VRRFRTGHHDTNHADITAALQGIGAVTYDTSMVGHGFPDAVAGWCGRTLLIEVLGEYTWAGERREHQARRVGWKGGEWLIVKDRDDLLRQLGVGVVG